MLNKIIDRLFIPNEGETIGMCILFISALIGVGLVLIYTSLNLPSKKHIRDNGFRSLNFKQIFKDTDFKGKYGTVIGIFLFCIGVIRGIGYTIYYIIHWSDIF